MFILKNIRETKNALQCILTHIPTNCICRDWFKRSCLLNNFYQSWYDCYLQPKVLLTSGEKNQAISSAVNSWQEFMRLKSTLWGSANTPDWAGFAAWIHEGVNECWLRLIWSLWWCHSWLAERRPSLGCRAGFSQCWPRIYAMKWGWLSLWNKF